MTSKKSIVVCFYPLLKLAACCITKPHTLYLNLGCLQIWCESSFTHCEKVCFELEPRASIPWECFPFYSNYMLIILWRAFIVEGARQPCWEEINVFDCELEEFIFHMKCQVLKVLLPIISLMHGFPKKNP